MSIEQLPAVSKHDKGQRWAMGGENGPYHLPEQISANELDNLIGKLDFSHSSLFGEFHRAHLSPRYAKFYARNYRGHLSKTEANLLE